VLLLVRWLLLLLLRRATLLFLFFLVAGRGSVSGPFLPLMVLLVHAIIELLLFICTIGTILVRILFLRRLALYFILV
jgi:hypothetical protein